jgi:two-component system chemotaxis sensor kinase CheA
VDKRTDQTPESPDLESRDGASGEDAPWFEIDQELITIFVGEALDHLGSIETSVLALEKAGDDAEALAEVFRLFHTLKGNAGALGFMHIQQLAHGLEDLLDRARAGAHQIGAAEIDTIFAAVDLITGMVRDAQGRNPASTVNDYADQRLALQTAIARLLGDPGGDATDLAGPGEPLDEPMYMGRSVGRGEGAVLPTIKVDTQKLDSLVDLVGELVIMQSMIHQHSGILSPDEPLNRTLAQFQRLTHDVHQGAMAMRLVPIRHTFARMHRLVRDLSLKSGKPIDLALSGAEIELDRKVVDEIADPLMHMLRNSVDHGIEDQETRSRAGKPRRGQLSLSASHQGGSVLITVSDDGRGLDADELFKRAVVNGLIEPGPRPSDAELHALIFRSGFSTAKAVTEISGRGVGMDVVRRSVESLRGRIEIRSRAGEGTTFLIRLPLTLATIEGLLLDVSGQRFVLPTFSVQESMRPVPERMRAVPGHGWLVDVRNQLIPVVRLSDLFNIPGAVADPLNAVLVVIDDDGRRLALMVDQLLGKENLVIKSLGETFMHVDGVAGGAILGDGRIGLIIDAGGLIRLCDRERAVHAA